MNKSILVILCLLIYACSTEPNNNPSINNQSKVPLHISEEDEDPSNYNYDINGKLISIDINGITTSDFEYMNDNLIEINEYSELNNEIIRSIEFTYNAENLISEINFKNSQNQIFSRYEYNYENNQLIEVLGYVTFDFNNFILNRTETLEYQNNKLFKKTIISNDIPNDIYIVYEYDDKNYPFINVPSILIKNYTDRIFHGNTNNIVRESTYILSTNELIYEDIYSYTYDNDNFPVESSLSNIDGTQPTKFYEYNQ